eukprot:TRINITY_DN20667_c0_g1_i1.p2 TRINITY_DN20667_c0_g1~~TRINITY_DN20667_c0_g1_i1.p2  ORF type:complete len:128 (+),score=18.03 TRINITY_DN20667_c0_g1_i1:163-546(+)
MFRPGFAIVLCALALGLVMGAAPNQSNDVEDAAPVVFAEEPARLQGIRAVVGNTTTSNSTTGNATSTTTGRNGTGTTRFSTGTSTSAGCFVGNVYTSPCPSAAASLSVQLAQLVLVAAAVILAASLW